MAGALAVLGGTEGYLGGVNKLAETGAKIAQQIGNARTRRQDDRHFKATMAFQKEQFEWQKEFEGMQFQQGVKQWGAEFAINEFATRKGLAIADVQAAYEKQAAGLANRGAASMAGQQEADLIERSRRDAANKAMRVGFTSGFKG